MSTRRPSIAYQTERNAVNVEQETHDELIINNKPIVYIRGAKGNITSHRVTLGWALAAEARWVAGTWSA